MIFLLKCKLCINSLHFTIFNLKQSSQCNEAEMGYKYHYKTFFSIIYMRILSSNLTERVP